jgi:hypothetical protein
VPSIGTEQLKRKKMKMPEFVDYVVFLRFDSDPSESSDILMAKVTVSDKIDRAYLGVGIKTGIAELECSMVEDGHWDEIKRITLETGGVEILGIYLKDEVDSEDLKIMKKS